MKNLWNNNEANRAQDELELRVYSSKLLGKDKELVLHGGGNTSVKIIQNNIFGEEEEILYVKGSGWDLETIEKEGFSPVKMDNLIKLVQLEELSDMDMVKYQRQALIDPFAPNPSIEAILHAIIPFKYVDHTHADAIVTVSNSKNGRDRLKEIFGTKVLIVPYIKPGFELAKKVYEMIKELDLNHYEAIILEHHGIFTYSNSAKESYDKMIDIVTKAQDYMYINNAIACDEEIEEESSNLFDKISDFFANLFKSSEEECIVQAPKTLSAIQIANIRSKISKLKSKPTLVKFDDSKKAHTFASTPKVSNLYLGGVLTPEHILKLKKEPAFIDDNVENGIDEAFEKFISKYKQYFEFHEPEDGSIPMHNPAPNWAIYKDIGLLYFGKNEKDLQVINDIAISNITAMLKAQKLGGYKSISSADMFEIEYWELELAKLEKSSSKEFEGKVVVLLKDDERIKQEFENNGAVVLVLQNFTKEAVEDIIFAYGGMDIFINNSDELDTLDLVSTYLKLGIDPKIVIINDTQTLENDTKELSSKFINENISLNSIKVTQEENQKDYSKLAISLSSRVFDNVNGVVL